MPRIDPLAFSLLVDDHPAPAAWGGTDWIGTRSRKRYWDGWQKRRRDPGGRFLADRRHQLHLPLEGAPEAKILRLPLAMPPVVVPAPPSPPPPVVEFRPASAFAPGQFKPATPIPLARAAPVGEPNPPCAICALRPTCKAMCAPMAKMLADEGMPEEIVQYKEKSKSPELTLYLANVRQLEEVEPEPEVETPERSKWESFVAYSRPLLEQVLEDEKVLTPDQRRCVRELLAGKRPAQIAREYRVVCKSRKHDPAVEAGGVCPSCKKTERVSISAKKPTISIMLRRARIKLEQALSRLFQENPMPDEIVLPPCPDGPNGVVKGDAAAALMAMFNTRLGAKA